MSKKEIFNNKFREYVKEKITPGENDRNFVSQIYKFFGELLGQDKTLQIGSYKRFTAIRPLHDLDILYILGCWDENNHNPELLLKKLIDKIYKGCIDKKELIDKIYKEYKNTTKYKVNILKQTHSVTVEFTGSEDKEIFAIDVVPAYSFSKNEFKQETYKIPEIIKKKHEQKIKDLHPSSKKMGWIHTDPRSYIKIAEELNQSNRDFRKTVKFIKAWKNVCKENDKNKNFKLKSFHIEQVITKYFNENKKLEIFDSIFKFFCEIPKIIEKPQIKDKADNKKYIDEYLNGLTKEQKSKIIQARDAFLIRLEHFFDKYCVESLIKANFYKRNNSEKYLFDFNIPVLIEDNNHQFKIDGHLTKKDGFREGKVSEFLQKGNDIPKKREIQFYIKKDIEIKYNYTMWKVQNDKSSPEVTVDQKRGEITKDQTCNNPENTAYSGKHYVECYAISNNICIARDKLSVPIK